MLELTRLKELSDAIRYAEHIASAAESALLTPEVKAALIADVTTALENALKSALGAK